MAAQDCVDKIIAASNGKLHEDNIDVIFDELQRKTQRYQRENPLADSIEVQTAIVKQMSEERQLEDIIAKRNRALNIVRTKERDKFYEKNGHTAKSLSTLNTTSQRGIEGADFGVEGQARGLEVQLISAMSSELESAGLMPLLSKRTKDFDRDVANDLWALTDKTANGSNNKNAKAVAEIIGKYQERARQLQNDAGAWIGKEAGYIVRQSHDALTVGRDFAKWRDTIMPRLHERTFDGVRDREDFLLKAWEGIKSGLHHKTNDQSAKMAGFKGPSNLAKKVSQERVLHFKDADAWFEYNETFGTGSLLESVASGLNNAANATALMRVWGPNPQAAFEADIARLQKKNINDPKELDKLRGNILKSDFDILTGQAQRVGNASIAAFGANFRAINTMTGLGGAVLSGLSDIPAQAATLKHNGIGYLEGTYAGLESIFRGRGSQEQKEIASALGAGLQGVMGDIYQKFGATDTLNGKMSKAMRLFFKANLQRWWTDSLKTGVALILSRNMELQRRKPFSSIDSRFVTNLRRYGIGEKEWAHIQRMDTKAADGRNYITPDGVDTLGLSKREASELKSKLSSYYAGQIAEAFSDVGVRTRSIATWGGHARGTVAGEAIRGLMQFKTYGISFTSNHLLREWQRGAKPDYAGFAYMMAGMTTMGYASMVAKDIWKGRTPRVPTDWESGSKIWAAAFAQGGGAGIFGDFLFGEFSRSGSSPIGALAGPSFGKVEQALKLFGSIKDVASGAVANGEAGDELNTAGDQAYKFVKDNIPGLNLFYAKAALEYGVLHSIQEAMNPGALARMERRVERDNGQSFFLSPSSSHVKVFD